MKLADAERQQDLYPERHLNVFVPYASHDLDYNVTRALVATLRWSRPELTREFLAEVVGVEAGAGAWHYDLQSCDYEDFDPAAVARQVVLGISRAGRLAGLPSLDDINQDAVRSVLRMPFPAEVKLEEVRRLVGRPELDPEDLATLDHSLGELEEGSLPDGWIFSAQAGVCVLIEAKLLERLDLYQLQRYADVYFRRAPGPEDVVLKTWAEVAAFFAARRADPDPRTAFLCAQLHDYLDLLGLAPFSGFRPYDFDLDAAQDTRPKFLGFAEQVRTRAAAAGLALGSLRPTPTGARLPFADAGLPGELALDLLEEGLRVELRLGDAPGGRLAGRAAVDALLETSGDGERNPLAGSSAPADLTVRIERLRAPLPEGGAYVERETLHEAFDPAGFGEVVAELRRQHPPAERARDLTGHYRRGALAVGRILPRPEVIAHAAAVGDEVAARLQDLARVARQLLPAPSEG